MSELKNFKLPDVGEGLTEAEIVRWHVQPGDEIKINQIIVEIETAKALVELPSPYAGVVADLLVPEGQSADVGTPIISVQVGGGGNGTTTPVTPNVERVAAPPHGEPDLIVDQPPQGGIEPGCTARWHPTKRRRRPLRRKNARPSWSATASSSARPSAGPANPAAPPSAPPSRLSAPPPPAHPRSPGSNTGLGRNVSLGSCSSARLGG